MIVVSLGYTTREVMGTLLQIILYLYGGSLLIQHKMCVGGNEVYGVQHVIG